MLIKAMKAIVRRVVNFFISIYQLSYLYSYIFYTFEFSKNSILS